MGKKQSNAMKYLILVICGISGSIIYRLPFLRETYYQALGAATGSTNAQLGMLMSAYGIVNLILYLPGGWAADKFSARGLMTFSMVSTGVTGFYFATFPPFGVILLLHGLWAVTTVFTFWAACIKVVRELGDSSEQGKLFGYWYLGKGLTSTIVGFITVPIFSRFGEGQSGLRAVIIFISVITILTGILCWFLIPKDEPVAEAEKGESGFSFAEAVSVLKMPSVWLAGLAAFCTWSFYIGFGFITPYLTDVFQMGESQVAIVSVIRANILFAVGGLLGGKLADKCKTKSKFMEYAFIGMILLTVLYIFIPGQKNMLTLALVNMIAMGTFVYCANAVFFSLIDEANVPVHLTGTAAGMISLLAYVPDVYQYIVFGNIIDANPGAKGYKIVFVIMVGFAVVGLIATILLHKRNHAAMVASAETK